MESVKINDTQTLRVHDPNACTGHYCSAHNPSPQAEAIGKRWWRQDRGMMERVCPDGIGHPDPDEIAYRERAGLETEYFSVHGCDGCCASIGNNELKGK